jgi:hypothetical protein
MKKILISIVLLTSTAAVAYSDSDPANTINPGSTITADVDLVFQASKKIIFKNGVAYHSISEIGDGPYCEAGVSARYYQPYHSGVMIAEGTSLTLTSNSQNSHHFASLHFQGLSGNNFFMYCFMSKYEGKSTRMPTVGEMKQALKNNFSLQLADPMEF